MLAQAPMEISSKPAFPLADIEATLRRELEEAEAESNILHPGWQVPLDSLRMVTVITAVEKLLGIKLPPEKVVKRGGHKTVDEGIKFMTNKIREVWTKHHQ